LLESDSLGVSAHHHFPGLSLSPTALASPSTFYSPSSAICHNCCDMPRPRSHQEKHYPPPWGGEKVRSTRLRAHPVPRSPPAYSRVHPSGRGRWMPSQGTNASAEAQGLGLLDDAGLEGTTGWELVVPVCWGWAERSCRETRQQERPDVSRFWSHLSRDCQACECSQCPPISTIVISHCE
jgi:hypothetical protein